MPSAKIAVSTHLRFRQYRARHNSFYGRSDLRCQSFNHGVRRFAESNRKDTGIGVQIVKILADAQNATFILHVAGKTPSYGCVSKNLGEDGPCSVTHFAEPRFAGWLRHAR